MTIGLIFTSASDGHVKKRSADAMTDKFCIDGTCFKFTLQQRCQFLQQFDATIGISPFVVVPADEFKEAIVECHTGTGIENRRTRIVNKVARNHLILRIAQNAL